MAKLLRFVIVAAAALSAAPARAQSVSSGAATAAAIDTSTAPLALTAGLGPNLPIDKGPWVLGEVLFVSNGRVVTDYTWRDRVRGVRGSLYTKTDIQSDVDSLMGLGKFGKVEPSLHEIAGAPVPPEFATIAASTNTVRLVFAVAEKGVATSTAAARRPLPPSPVSGIILTPTAYRGTGRFTTPGLGLDASAMYVIGRLYGKNSFPNSPTPTNYLDRVGVWLLTADGKMQIQSEAEWRPAVAVGGQGIFTFRDSPQPNINDPNPAIKANASQKSTKVLGDGYFVISKKFGPVRTSAGVMQGNAGDMVASFSEFLTPDALRFFAGLNGGAEVHSRTMPFASLLMVPKPQYPLGVEFVKFDGALLNPWMLNFKLGYFLHLNFDIGYLHFDGGYDILGLIAFRTNLFPTSRTPEKK